MTDLYRRFAPEPDGSPIIVGRRCVGGGSALVEELQWGRGDAVDEAINTFVKESAVIVSLFGRYPANRKIHSTKIYQISQRNVAEFKVAHNLGQFSFGHKRNSLKLKTDAIFNKHIDSVSLIELISFVIHRVFNLTLAVDSS